MNPHEYIQSVAFEKSKQAFCNNFYLTILQATNIHRFDHNTEEDVAFQKKDIDLKLTLQATSYTISEKFRTFDYGDIYLELYSKYPDTKGWIEDSEADFLAYFTPKRAIMIEYHSLRAFFMQLKGSIDMAAIETFHAKHPYRNSSTQLTLKVGNYKLHTMLIQAYNKTSTNSWHTIGISIQPVDLSNLLVKYKIFTLV